MRYLIVALVLLACPALVSAQRPSRATQQSDSPPPPSIGLPLPSIGLPLPPLGLDTSLDRTPHETARRPPSRGGRRHGRSRPAIVFFGAPYAFGYDPYTLPTTPGVMTPSVEEVNEAYEPEPATGRLYLEVEPAHLLQIFVDGEYVGTSSDFGGVLDLAPGTRRIELRAPGYEALELDARIVAGRSITYRNALTAAPATSPSRPPASEPGTAAATTFYLIPGCYMGNVPPHEVTLPAGCDPDRAVTYKR